jgi:hypothetical protein
MRWISAALALLCLTACASSTDVSRKLEFCCGPPGTELTSYDLQLIGVPGFLVPYLRDELEAALRAKGMTPATAEPTALVTLAYSEIYPDADEPLPDDGFADPMLSQRSRRFVALVTLEIRRADDGAEVLRGTLSRMHTVSVGEYMHQRARVTIRAGFDGLLKRLPQR